AAGPPGAPGRRGSWTGPREGARDARRRGEGKGLPGEGSRDPRAGPPDRGGSAREEDRGGPEQRGGGDEGGAGRRQGGCGGGGGGKREREGAEGGGGAEAVQNALQWVTAFGNEVTAAIEEIESMMHGGRVQDAERRVQAVNALADQTRAEIEAAIRAAAHDP